jgi:predicted NBD/HSP70 family sugar kinase
MEPQIYLVFDIGATKTRLALSHDGKTFSDPLIFDTDITIGGQARLISYARQLVGEQKIALVAGGVPGTVDRTKGVLLETPNMEWGRVDLAGLFKQAFRAKLILENDTALVGLGEAHAGAGSPKGVMAYFTISTGVNGVRIVDGQIDRSTYGFEIGRQIISPAGEPPVTLEEMIGGRAMQERYGRLPRSIDDPAVWRQETRLLAHALYNLTLEWSPELIVLGGSMMRDIPIPWIRDELEALPKIFPKWPQLKTAKLETVGGLYGALELIKEVGRA